MKRSLLLPLIFSNALSPHAFAAAEVEANSTAQMIQDEYEGLKGFDKKLQAICENEKLVNLEDTSGESKKTWKSIVDYLKSSRIKRGGSIDFSLIDSTSIELGNDTISENSLGGRYSGVDKWKIGASLLPFTSDILDVGVSASREVTFIQQYNSKCKSLSRSAYDPITKIPISAEQALTKLKPGDFVAFSAPLTFSLGKAAERFFDLSRLSGTFKAGVKVFATGEFNVHVFRMNDNYVRVRFFDSKARGVTGSAGLQVIGFKVLGTNLLDVTPIEFNVTKSNSEIFSADYIFNLNDLDSRNQYDKLLGRKLNIKDSIVDATINPFLKDSELRKRAFNDLEGIDQISREDSQNEPSSRRIIRLTKGENSSKSTGFGVGFKITSLARAKSQKTHTNSDISQYNVNNENRKYNINTITTQNDYSFFELWGQQDTHSTALLTDTDENYKPISSKGIQTVRVKEELTFTKEEILGLKNRLARTLPAVINAILVFPEVEHLVRPIANARVEQTLFINSHFLDQKRVITPARVEEELKHMLQTWGKFNSNPVDSNAQDTYETSDRRATYKIQGDRRVKAGKDPLEAYLKAYEREVSSMTAGIASLFNADANMSERIANYEKLRDIALFNEIGTILVLRLIPTEFMNESVVYKLAISGRGIETKISDYPKNADLTDTNIFNQILRDNAFLVDRSYNLRYYLSEKGIPFTLKEAIERAK